MYPSITTDNQKSVVHPPYGHPAAGIPVTSGSQFYGGGNQQQHHHTPPMNQQHHHVPPMNQQHHHVPPMNHSGGPPKPLGSWSTGLCDCCDDVPNCCITCWCPCITFGQIAEVVDKGATSCGMSGALYALIAMVIGCPCFYSCFYRSKIRQQYMLHETPCGDCLVHCCCESCALCQEYRELKHHGFDMRIGWQGNAERQNREVAMAPVVEEGMTR